jgi:glutathione S-transferase
MADEIILHHYDTSPFSEKVRLAFGLKGLAWRSVIQPSIMPKPDLIPLTGGYRRIPVMQVGADVFCDTQAILAEIERRAPTPALGGGLDFAVNLWADRLFFQPTVAVVFGALGDSVPEAFIKDREALSGQRFNVAAMKAAAQPMKGQWRAQASWIEAELARTGADWLGGATPSLADAAAYMNVWFVETFVPPLFPELTAGLDRTLAWRERVRAIGHGERAELSPQAALEIARAAEPAVPVDNDKADPLGLEPGAKVFVMADDYGRDRIEGRLVGANASRIALDREDPAVGAVRLHFPRAGYVAGPA